MSMPEWILIYRKGKRITAYPLDGYDLDTIAEAAITVAGAGADEVKIFHEGHKVLRWMQPELRKSNKQ